MNKNYLIITPLKIELSILIQKLESLGHKALNFNIENRIFYHFENLPYVITLGDHGKVNFAINTFDSVIKYKSQGSIDGVLCVGAGGALRDDIKVGHLVLGETAIEHDYKTNFIKSPLPNIPADTQLIKFFNPKDQLSNIHIGSIASGDEDIHSLLRAKTLSDETKAIAVAWEGIGGAKTCRFLNIPYLEIRGITDVCNFQDKDFDFKRNLKLAMGVCAEFLVNTNL